MENQYSVYVVFCKDPNLGQQGIIDKLLSLSTKDNDLLYCRSCAKKSEADVDRFVCCLRKDFYTQLTENCGFKRDAEFNITKYRIFNENLGTGMTYGFFIKCSETEEEKMRSIFQKLEDNGFLRNGSYSIKKPEPYPNGSDRGYFIVTFEKLGDKYPKMYIKKLKALLNNSMIDEKRIHVNWVSHSVLRDINNSVSKDRKQVPVN